MHPWTITIVPSSSKTRFSEVKLVKLLLWLQASVQPQVLCYEVIVIWLWDKYATTAVMQHPASMQEVVDVSTLHKSGTVHWVSLSIAYLAVVMLLFYLSLLLILVYQASPCLCLSKEDLYPYGGAAGDSVLASSDNGSALISVNQSIVVFGGSYDSLHVSSTQTCIVAR